MPSEADLVSTETQRLRAEVKRLERSLNALETSRWVRLNPKQLWREGIRRVSATRAGSAEPLQRTVSADPSLDASSDLVERFRTEVIARGRFSEVWFTRNIDRWEPILLDLVGRPSRVLEIGSLEGLSAAYLLWRLPEVELTCIDTFAGSPEYATSEVDISQLEATFDENIALVDSARVNKLVGDSRRMLLELSALSERFDLVFVDGSHDGLDVTVDAALSWKLVKTNGVVIFDDYTWAWPGTRPVERPGPAIDAFLSLIDGDYELLLKDFQVAIRKTSD